MTRILKLDDFFKIALVLVVLGIVSERSEAGLIKNGSFESPASNGASPDFWTAITNSYGAWNGTNKLTGGGNYVLHPGANFNAGGRYQDITTIPGQSYDFSFWGTGFTSGSITQKGNVQVGTPGSNPTSLTLNNLAQYVNFEWSVPRHQSVNDWRKFDFTFKPTTTTTRVSFQNIFNGANQNAINVDLVSLALSVASVPEPSSMAIFAMIGLACGAASRRRMSRL